MPAGPSTSPIKQEHQPRLRLDVISAGVAVGLGLVLLIWQVRQLGIPVGFDYVEGMMLNGARLALEGSSLYPPLGRLPYVITAYTPLYYYLCAFGMRLVGYGFLFGRLLSLVSVLAIAWGIAGMILRLGGRRASDPPFAADRAANCAAPSAAKSGAPTTAPTATSTTTRRLAIRATVTIAVLAASAFYLTLPARNWAVLMRVDALEVALAFWGFYCAIFLGRPRLAAGLFLLSFLTKHTVFAAPAAVMLAWWFEGRRRDALRLAAFLAGGAGLAFALLGLASRGAVYTYLFGIHQDALLPLKWFKEFLFLGRMMPVVFALSAWLLVDETRRWIAGRGSPGENMWERGQSRSIGAPRRWLAGKPASLESGGKPPHSKNGPGMLHGVDPVACYLVAAFFSTLYGMKFASFWNHYLEFCAVACLAAGYAALKLCGVSTPDGELKSAATRGQAPAPSTGTRLAWEPVPLLLQTALVVQCLLVLPTMLPWPPGRWFHVLLAAALAAAVAWCSHRLWRSSAAAWMAFAVVLTFPGVWHWSLSNLSLWPILLGIAAFACLIEGQPWIAAALTLAAAMIGASLPPVSAAVACALLASSKPTTRIAGLLFIAVLLGAVRLVSPESNIFHWYGSVTMTVDAAQWLPQIGLLVVLALAAYSARKQQPAVGAPLFAVSSRGFCGLRRQRVGSHPVPALPVPHPLLLQPANPAGRSSKEWGTQRVSHRARAGEDAAPGGAAIPYAAFALVCAVFAGDMRAWMEMGAALALLAAGSFVREPAASSTDLHSGASTQVEERGADLDVRASADPQGRALGCPITSVAVAALFVQIALLSPFALWLSPRFDEQQLRYLYAKVAATPGPVLTDDIGLLAAARKPVLTSDPYAARLAQKYFPDQPLVEMLRAGAISRVVLMRDPTAPDSPPGDTDPVWSEGLLSALRENYRKTGEYDIGGQRYYFFSPRNSKQGRACDCVSHRSPTCRLAAPGDDERGRSEARVASRAALFAARQNERVPPPPIPTATSTRLPPGTRSFETGRKKRGRFLATRASDRPV